MSVRLARSLAVLLAAFTVPACGGGGKDAPPPPATLTARVSVDSAGNQATGFESRNPAISADGRFVAFESVSADLVAGDTNGAMDVFVHDTQTGVTTRVSVSSAGTQSDGNSAAAALSGDGQIVAFHSTATNLVAGDTNGVQDIFVHDRQTGVTTRISVPVAGGQADGASSEPSISADGRYVVFQTDATNLVAGDTNGATDVVRHDQQSGQIIYMSTDSVSTPGDGASTNPRISADGQLVAFQSSATNLVAGDTNGAMDIFVHEVSTFATVRVSVGAGGAEGNGGSFMGAISGDGRYVTFGSLATNLVAGDTNGTVDAFVHDRTTGATSRVSVTSAGAQGNSESGVRSISGDGRYIVFDSDSTNLVPGDTNGEPDAFLRDTVAGTTTLLSISAAGGPGDGPSGSQVISADGRFVAFNSTSTNLVAGDTNAQGDVFRRGPLY